MQELSSLLSTIIPKLCSLPEDDALGLDPVDWAEHLFESNPGSPTLQVLESGAGGPDKQVSQQRLVKFRRNGPIAIKRFLRGVRSGKPYHGRLALFDKRADTVYRLGGGIEF